MFFDAGQAKSAIGDIVPEKSAHSTGPGQESKLNPQQFPGKGAPAEAEGAGAAEGAAAGGEAAAGGASLAELAPLIALA